MSINRVVESCTKSLLGIDWLVKLVAAHLQTFADSPILDIKGRDTCLHKHTFNLYRNGALLTLLSHIGLEGILHSHLLTYRHSYLALDGQVNGCLSISLRHAFEVLPDLVLQLLFIVPILSHLRVYVFHDLPVSR